MNDNATLTGILGTTTSFTGFMVSMMPHTTPTGARVIRLCIDGSNNVINLPA